jgi:hypothetical protein
LIYSGKGEEEQHSEGVGILLTRAARNSHQMATSMIKNNVATLQNINTKYFHETVLCPNKTG